MTSNKFLSVIIPLYNEEGRVVNLHHIYKYLSTKKFDWEIVIVDDGSIDNTKKEVKTMLKSHLFKKTRLISYSQNRGKGFAIRKGMFIARGKYRLFTDIDLSTPIEEFNKFLPFLNKFDLIIGSRKTKGSNLKKRQSRIRENLGKYFTLLSQLILQLEISDFTCGFKCFSKKASEDIFKRQKIERWSFDSEILFIANKLGYRIKEVPVTWIDDPRSKVKFPQDIISSLKDLYKIRSSSYN